MDDEREEYERQFKIVEEKEQHLSLMLAYHHTVKGHTYRRQPVLEKYYTEIEDHKVKLQRFHEDLERKCFLQNSDLRLIAQTKAGLANNDAVAKVVISVCNSHPILRSLLYNTTFRDSSTINSLLKSTAISPELKFEIIQGVNRDVLPDLTEVFFAYMDSSLFEHTITCLDTGRVNVDPQLLMSVSKSRCLKLISHCLTRRHDLKGYFLMAFLTSAALQDEAHDSPPTTTSSAPGTPRAAREAGKAPAEMFPYRACGFLFFEPHAAMPGRCLGLPQEAAPSHTKGHHNHHSPTVSAARPAVAAQTGKPNTYELEAGCFTGRYTFQVTATYSYACTPAEEQFCGNFYVGWRLRGCPQGAPGHDPDGMSWGVSFTKEVKPNGDIVISGHKWYAGRSSPLSGQVKVLREAKLTSDRVMNVTMLLDMNLQIMEMYVERQYWGVVFSDVPTGSPLFPCVTLRHVKGCAGKPLVAISDNPDEMQHGTFPTQNTHLETGVHLFVELAKAPHLLAVIPKALEKHVVALRECPAEYACFNKTGKVLSLPPIHFCLYVGYRACAEIIACGRLLVPDGKDSLGMLPSILAASRGHMRVVEILLSRGADLCATSVTGLSLLAAAIIGGCFDTARLVISAIKALSSDQRARAMGYTVPATRDSILLVALKCQMLSVVPLLLDLDADCSAVNGRGTSALTYACTNVEAACCRQIIASRHIDSDTVNHIDASKGKHTALHHAARRGLSCVVAALLEKGADPTSRNSDGDIPLALAIKTKDEALAHTLLAVLPDDLIGSRDRKGDTPLILAASCGILSLIDALLARQSLASLPTNKAGVTPLMAALINENLHCADRLCAAPMNLNAADQKGWTALSRAASIGCVPVVEKLLDLGAAVTLKTKDGKSPLTVAIEHRHEEAALRIIESAHAHINVREKAVGNTIHSDYALHQGLRRVYEILVSLGAPANPKLIRALSEKKLKKNLKSAQAQSMNIVRSELKKHTNTGEDDVASAAPPPRERVAVTVQAELYFLVSSASRFLDASQKRKRSLLQDAPPPELFVVLSGITLLCHIVGYDMDLSTEYDVLEHMRHAWCASFPDTPEAYWALRHAPHTPAHAALFATVLKDAGSPECTHVQLLNHIWPPLSSPILREKPSDKLDLGQQVGRVMRSPSAVGVADSLWDDPLEKSCQKALNPRPPKGRNRGASRAHRHASTAMHALAREEMPLSELLAAPEPLASLLALMAKREKDVGEVAQCVLAHQEELTGPTRQRNAMGMEALMVAAVLGCDTSSRTLLSCGAEPNVAWADGITPLMLAVVNRHPRVVRLLMGDVRIDLCLTTHRTSHTALTLALNEMPDEAQRMVDTGSAPVTTCGGGDYPLSIALRKRADRLVSKLLPSASVLSGMYCFAFDCCNAFAFDTLEHLFRLTGIPQVSANQNCVLLHLIRIMPNDPTVQAKMARIAKQYLLHTVSLVGSYRSPTGTTALHILCKKHAVRMLDVVAMSIGKDLSVTEKDDDRRIPLECLAATTDLDKSPGAVRLFKKTELRKTRRWLLERHSQLGTRCFVSLMFKLFDTTFLVAEKESIELGNLFWLGFIVQLWFSESDDGAALLSQYERLPPICFKLADPVIVVLFLTLAASNRTMNVIPDPAPGKNSQRLPAVERRKQATAQAPQIPRESLLVGVFLNALFTPLKADCENCFDKIVELLGRFGHAKLLRSTVLKRINNVAEMSSETRLRILQNTASACQVDCLVFLLTVERGFFAEPVMRKFLLDEVLSGNECVHGDKERCVDLLLNFRMPLSVKFLQWKEQHHGTLDYQSTMLGDTLLHIGAINGQFDVVEHLLKSECFSMLFETNICGYRALDYATKDTVWRLLREGERSHGFSLRNPEYLISWSELQHKAMKNMNTPEITTLLGLLEGQHLIVDTAAESEFAGHVALGSTAAFILKTALAAGIKPAKAVLELPAQAAPFLCEIDTNRLTPTQRLAAVKQQLMSINFGNAMHFEIPLLPHWGYTRRHHTITKQRAALGQPLRPLSAGSKMLPAIRSGVRSSLEASGEAATAASAAGGGGAGEEFGSQRTEARRESQYLLNSSTR